MNDAGTEVLLKAWKDLENNRLKNAYNKLTRVYRQTGTGANTVIKREINRIRDLAEPLEPLNAIQLAMLYDVTRQLKNACRLYRQAVPNFISNAWLHERIGHILVQMGNSTEADTWYDKARDLRTTPRRHTRHILWRRKTSKFTKFHDGQAKLKPEEEFEIKGINAFTGMGKVFGWGMYALGIVVTGWKSDDESGWFFTIFFSLIILAVMVIYFKNKAPGGYLDDYKDKDGR